MATNKQGTRPNQPGAKFPLELDRSGEGAQEAEQVTKDVARGGDPRSTQPPAPTGLVGASSRDAVARVKIVMQNALVKARQGQPSAWEAAAQAARLVQTGNLHPLVAQYKAEAIEYLEFKAAEVASLAESEKAEAVAGARQASGELGS